MYQISLSDFLPPPTRKDTTLSQDYAYMERYREKMVEMSNDLSNLLDAVMLNPRGLPVGSFTTYQPEPIATRIARKLGLVKTERPTSQVRGVLVQRDHRTIALITRHGTVGYPLLVVEDSATKHRVSQWMPDSYIRYILTDDRWINQSDATVAFARLYSAIAALLPQDHVLHIREAQLAEEVRLAS